jgi:thiamine monophosphate synthase
VARTGAAGVAVVGAVMAAKDPAEAVRGLLAAFRESPEGRL